MGTNSALKELSARVAQLPDQPLHRDIDNVAKTATFWYVDQDADNAVDQGGGPLEEIPIGDGRSIWLSADGRSVRKIEFYME